MPKDHATKAKQQQPAQRRTLSLPKKPAPAQRAPTRGIFAASVRVK